ncbi:MAG: hypothetical protein KDJ65_09095 [Anaerolineae bacterium]|nr:hypothetical protein [Anaerolineae bacterium]
MKQWFVVILLLAVSTVIAACGSATTATETENNPALAIPNFETKASSENAVTVEVTPLNLADGGASLDFEIAFNTHSVDLAFDPAAISVLRDDQGREYPAIGWEGAGPGGHHRSGTLRFKVLDYATTSIEVVLKGVADVPERVFHWSLMES